VSGESYDGEHTRARRAPFDLLRPSIQHRHAIPTVHDTSTTAYTQRQIPAQCPSFHHPRSQHAAEVNRLTLAGAEDGDAGEGETAVTALGRALGVSTAIGEEHGMRGKPALATR
jgi:hypothetical protein